jgi:hypothetical protein
MLVSDETDNVYLRRLPEDPDDHGEHATADAGADLNADDDFDLVADELGTGEDPRGAGRASRIRVMRHPGMTGTQRDYDELLLMLEEQVRRERDSWPEAHIRQEAADRFAAFVAESHPKYVDEYVKLMQVSFNPHRSLLRENIEAAACRRVPELVEIERLLSSCSMGRPADRSLPLAIFERAALSKARPEFGAHYEEFTGSNLELDWAYFGTPDMNVNRGRVRELSVARKAMKAMLERHSPSVLLNANLAILKRIADRHADDGFTDVGRYLVIDGTPIKAHVEQIAPVNAEHEAMIVKRTGAKYGFHGARNRPKKHWVGWTLLVIADMKTGLPVMWKLIGANESEFAHVCGMLDELFARAPWIDPEYLVGDSEYDRSARLALDLEARYGIHPVFPLRQNVGARWEWAASDGVPQCSKHGAMKRVQHDSADQKGWTVSRRNPRDAEAVKRGFDARTRWRCEGCARHGEKLTSTTYIKYNARLYTYLPRGGDHRLAATRKALMARRNIMESVNSTLKRRGIGEQQHHKVLWATRPIHMQWLIGMALLGMTLRREVHETDLYEQCAQEAWELGLTKIQPVTPPPTAGRLAQRSRQLAAA